MTYSWRNPFLCPVVLYNASSMTVFAHPVHSRNNIFFCNGRILELRAVDFVSSPVHNLKWHLDSQEQYCCEDEAVVNEMGMTTLFCFLKKMEYCTNDPLPMTVCEGGLGYHDELNSDNEENQFDNTELTTKHKQMLPLPIPLRTPAKFLHGKRKEPTPNEKYEDPSTRKIFTRKEKGTNSQCTG